VLFVVNFGVYLTFQFGGFFIFPWRAFKKSLFYLTLLKSRLFLIELIHFICKMNPDLQHYQKETHLGRQGTVRFCGIKGRNTTRLRPHVQGLTTNPGLCCENPDLLALRTRFTTSLSTAVFTEAGI
jgi:hypothetical protein